MQNRRRENRNYLITTPRPYNSPRFGDKSKPPTTRAHKHEPSTHTHTFGCHFENRNRIEPSNMNERHESSPLPRLMRVRSGRVPGHLPRSCEPFKAAFGPRNLHPSHPQLCRNQHTYRDLIGLINNGRHASAAVRPPRRTPKFVKIKKPTLRPY